MAKEIKQMKKLPAKSADAAKKANEKKVAPVAAKPAKKAEQKGGGAAEKMIQSITNRYRVTAREARDIVTAVNNVRVAATGSDYDFSAAKNGTGKNEESQRPGGKKNQLNKSVKDLKKQVVETGKAAITGKKQTSPGLFYTITGDEPAYLKPGRKRK